MAKMDRPNFFVPLELRCEAVAKPAKQTWQSWQWRERQCCRRAQQGRGGHIFCWQHANAKEMPRIYDFPVDRSDKQNA